MNLESLKLLDKRSKEDLLFAGQHATFFLHDFCHYLTNVKYCYESLASLSELQDIGEKERALIEIGKKGINEIASICVLYTKLINNNSPIKFEEVLVKTVIDDVYSSLSNSFETSNFELNFNIPEDFTWMTDPTLFYQCILNILKNSIQHQDEVSPKKINVELQSNKLIFSNPLSNIQEISTKRVGIGFSFLEYTCPKINLNLQVEKNENFTVILSTKEKP